MKVERFITEYAAYIRKAVKNNDLMNSGIKQELLRRCDAAIDARAHGYITADEAVRMIAGEQGEDMEKYMTKEA